jgi:prepilin signal peptidase PulO-like enzyme (type II secretory pathway)
MKSLAEKYKFNDTEQNIILNEFKLRQLQMSDRKRKKKIIERLFYFIICIFIVVVLVIDPSHLLIPDNYFIITLMILFVISAFLLSSIADLAINILDTSLKHYLKDELIVLQEKLELEELAGTYEAKIEDKQFKQHQRELKRYYDMNLEQSKKVFALGIIVIFFGAMILIGTLLFFGPNANENILPLVVGCISGLLTDFVGIIFIRMYSSIVKTSVEFHNKLTYSNSLLLANLVTTRIVDCSVKDDTLKSIAQEIIKSSNQNLKECDLHFD